MVAPLLPGAATALPPGGVVVSSAGAATVVALVVGADGRPRDDRDVVEPGGRSAPGVTAGRAGLSVVPEQLRPGATGVALLAVPPGRARVALAELTVATHAGRVVARLAPPFPHADEPVLLASIEQDAGCWCVRAAPRPRRPSPVPPPVTDGIALETDERGRIVPARPAFETAVVQATNAERVLRGLAPLDLEPRLSRAAQAHSEDMARRAFFAHADPDGVEVAERALAAGYRYRAVAENIAAGQASAVAVVAAWMASPGHRANILRAGLTQIGVGRASGGPYGVYWTQVLGTPG